MRQELLIVRAKLVILLLARCLAEGFEKDSRNQVLLGRAQGTFLHRQVLVDVRGRRFYNGIEPLWHPGVEALVNIRGRV